MSEFTDSMRKADEMGLPNLRRAFVEKDSRKWGGEKPPCCAIAGAKFYLGIFNIS